MAVLNIAAVRDWFNDRFKLNTDNPITSVLTLTFDAALLGETWTVTDGGDETYTGTVGATLTAKINLRQLETLYTVTCGAVTRKVKVGLYYMPFSVSLIPLSISNTLPESTEQNVITFATIQNVVAGAASWGQGDKPITASSGINKTADGEAVLLNEYSSNDVLAPHITFDDATQSATIYMVFAIVGGNHAASDSYHNIVSKANGSDSTRVMIYGSGTGNGGTWEVRGSGSGSTSGKGVYPFGGKYVVLALRYSADSASLTKGWLNTATLSPATAQVSSNILYFATERRTSMSAAQKLSRSCDLAVKMIAVVNEAETDEAIAANVANLMEVFEI